MADLSSLGIRGDDLRRLELATKGPLGLAAVDYALSRRSISIHLVRDVALGIPRPLPMERLLGELKTAGRPRRE